MVEPMTTLHPLTTKELLNGLSPDLTLRFFATFARMEFALKQLGLLRFTAEGEVAQMGQPRLVARLGVGLFQIVQSAHVAETLIATPPKHFIVVGDGGVEFGSAARSHCDDLRFDRRHLAGPQQSFSWQQAISSKS
jgi:hypothetical protein